MKLYYAAGSCSLSPHIVLHEAGQKIELVKVDLRAKTTEHGDNYLEINPKGAVPALQLDNGEILTEGAAMVQYIADLNPTAALAPANGTYERVKLQETLNYIASEVHKSLGILFAPIWNDEEKAKLRALAAKKLDYINEQLSGKNFIFGDNFSIADAYLFTVSNWVPFVGLSYDAWPNLVAYRAKISARPNVLAAMKAEGLA
jgi:glutathione S-transferase